MNDINRKCEYYNWGGKGTEERPFYPREYGARCEFYNRFFSQEEDKIIPDCSECKNNLEEKIIK